MDKIIESLPHLFTENMTDFNAFHDYIKTSEKWNKIIQFLKEAEQKDYTLNADDIRHVLKMEFDYVRKHNDS